MPLYETECLILKSYDLADADKIVVLLTREHGVVRGVAKGVKRLKSRFGSGLEPFSVINVAYFQKETLELVSIQKAEIVTSNFAAASSPDFLQKFSFLSDLVVTMLPPHDPNETLYRMVKACVETAVTIPGSIQAIGVYFELWLLRLSGYLPDWERCDECGRQFVDAEDAFLVTNMHLLCSGCDRTGRGTFDAANRAIVRAALRQSPATFAVTVADAGGRLADISAVLRRLISQAIGRELNGEVRLTTAA